MTLLPDSSWLTCPRPNARAPLRLFCFPYAGAGASVFRPWAAKLYPTVEVYAVQLPGRERRIGEPSLTSLHALVAPLATALLPYLDKPFAFFGHSMGALISFEVVRYLRQRHNFLPIHLFVSGCRAPHIPASHPLIHRLPNIEFSQALHRYGGTPEDVLQNSELMALFRPILRADLAINETYTYRHESPLNCSISAFGGLQDSHVKLEHLSAWYVQTQGTFTLDLFPGGHFFLKDKQEQLLAVIQRAAI
ncbi:MAG: alpha/beta fold hydrolase [Phormidesmis sp.]